MQEKYKIALTEVKEVLNNTEKEVLKKIPIRFMNFIENNMSKNIKVLINNDVGILEQDISNEAKAIVALIYRDYVCTTEERATLIESERKKREKEEKIKQEKYSINW